MSSLHEKNYIRDFIPLYPKDDLPIYLSASQHGKPVSRGYTNIQPHRTNEKYKENPSSRSYQDLYSCT